MAALDDRGLPLVPCAHAGNCVACDADTEMRDARVDVHACSEACWREFREFIDAAAALAAPASASP